MANVLKQLLESLKRQDPIQGKVITISGGVVTVSTSAGIKEVTNAGATSLRNGDTVKLNGSTVVGVVRDEGSLPVYRL